MKRSRDMKLLQIFYTLYRCHEEGKHTLCMELAESMKTITKSKELHKRLDRIIGAEGRYSPVYLWCT